MGDRARKVLTEAMSLTLDERAEIAVELLASLDGERDADNGSVSTAEITGRAKRARAGETTGIDSETVRASARRIVEATGSGSCSSSNEPGQEVAPRRTAARREVLAHLGASAEVTPEEAEQIRREWEE